MWLPCASDGRWLHTYIAEWRVGYTRIMWDIMGYSGIFWDIRGGMFFRKDSPQTEGRRDADPLIKKRRRIARIGKISLFRLGGEPHVLGYNCC